MDSAFTILSIESVTMSVVGIIIMYMAVLSYRLPYSQVVLAYAGFILLNAILVKLISPKIQINEQRRPLDARTVSRQAMSLLGTGILDIVAGFAGFIAVIIIASYRFSFLEILGIFAAGMATGVVANGVMAVL